MESSSAEGGGSDWLTSLDATLAALSLWVDPLSHSPRLMVEAEKAHGRYGCALAALEKHIEKESDGSLPSRKMWEERAALQEKLGWSHWSEASSKALAARFPEEYQPF